MTDSNIEVKKAKSLYIFFLAFIIPVIIIIIIYFVRGIYPFGENTFLRSDMYHQYAPFHKEFFNKLNQNESLAYSWNIGMGVNFTSLYAYYLASPVNWLLRFIFPNYIIEFMNFFLIVKTGLASLTFCYYLTKRFNKRQIQMAAFSVFYALSSYMAAFNWNVMWLDCIVLLPLIVLGLERLIKYKKPFLYCISLALCILTNYYISIMVCIFCFLYFFVSVFTISMERGKGFYLKRIFSFAVYSLLAGGLSAVLLIPVLYALGLTASSGLSLPDSLVKYFSVFEILSRGLINVDPAIFTAHDANIYSSVIVFLMLPLYLFSKHSGKREKLGKMLLIVIFILSFNFNILTYIWHGLHFPNSLPSRQSFIFIFLVLTMSYEAFIYIKKYTDKQIFGSFACAVTLFLLFEHFITDENYTFSIVYLSLIFLGFYLLIILCFRNTKLNKNFIIYLLFIVTICEAAINTNETAFGTTSRTSYMADNQAVEKVLENVNEKDKSFYRTEKIKRRTKNDAAWHDYKGVSVFSSTSSKGVTDFLGTLGFEHSMNAYSFNGCTPLTSSLFSVKYMLSDTIIDDHGLMEYVTNSENIYLYKNKYTLPLGFMLESDFDSKFASEGNNPFLVQNSFVEESTGLVDMFTTLAVNNTGDLASSLLHEDNYVYAYIYGGLDSVNVNITDRFGENVYSNTFNDLKRSYILDLGYVRAGSTVNISTTEDKDNLSLYIAGFNKDVFISAYNILNSNPLDITYYDSTSIKGTINPARDGLMYTSIPYDEGFSVYVDDKKQEIQAFQDAFICLPLSKGLHEIEFKYSPQGILEGSIVSAISLIILLFLIVYNFLRRRQKG